MSHIDLFYAHDYIMNMMRSQSFTQRNPCPATSAGM